MLSIGLSSFKYQPPDDLSDQFVRKKQKSKKGPVIRTSATDEYNGVPLDVSDPEGWTEEENDAPVVLMDKKWTYNVMSYNILCKSESPVLLEEDAETFFFYFVFDFDRQEKFGILYQQPGSMCEEQTPYLQHLFNQIVKYQKPLILHNGFIDLMFLYQSFYLQLPSKMGSFVTNLHQLFPSGIYDTKYITDIVMEYRSSFLEYVYYYLQRQNVQNIMNDKVHVYITFDTNQLNDKVVMEHRNMKTRINDVKPENIEICKHYSRHGWCSEASDCKMSHNIDLILDHRRIREEKRKRGKRSNKCAKKTQENLVKLSNFNESLTLASGVQKEGEEKRPDERHDSGGETTETTSEPKTRNGSEPLMQLDVTGRVKSGAHRSGYDAFMTGYTFATITYSYCDEPPFCRRLNSKTAGLRGIANCIFLSGKTMPLKIRKGNFDRATSDHETKLQMIRSGKLDKFTN